MPSLNVAAKVFFCFTQFVILTNDNIELNVQCSDSASRQTFTSVKTAVFVVCRESSQNPAPFYWYIFLQRHSIFPVRIFLEDPLERRGAEKRSITAFSAFLNLDGIYLSPSSCLPFSICLSSPQVREQPWRSPTSSTGRSTCLSSCRRAPPSTDLTR